MLSLLRGAESGRFGLGSKSIDFGDGLQKKKYAAVYMCSFYTLVIFLNACLYFAFDFQYILAKTYGMSFGGEQRNNHKLMQ